MSLTGDKRFKATMLGAPRVVRRRVNKKLRRLGKMLAVAAKKEISGSRSKAKRQGRPVTAKPRRLGIDSGKGRKSIKARFARGKEMLVVTVAAWDRDYMSIHELRGKYVWLKPAARKVRKRVKGLFKGIFGKPLE